MLKQAIKFIIYIPFFLIAFVLFLLYKIFFSSERFFRTISECLSLFPGYAGYFLNKGFFKLTLGTGNNLQVDFGTVFMNKNIIIEKDVYIGQNCLIGSAIIESGVKMGSNIVIGDGIKNKRVINIGSNSWIGNKSVINADIGDKCIIGAGSVVVSPIPNNSVAVGNPARVIRKNVR